VLDWSPEDLIKNMDKAYRVNSWVARQRKLPRDVVIYFSKRSIRNDIIQAFYNQRFQIDGQDIIILKEIPSKILRKRKEFAFLADELKAQQINFRWEIPVGMVVNFNGIKHRLNTVLKAKNFFHNVLKIDSLPLPLQKDQPKQVLVGSQESFVEELSLSSEEVRQITSRVKDKVKENKIRTAFRYQDKDGKRKKIYDTVEASVSDINANSSAISASVVTPFEAVKGARRKAQEDVRALFVKLRATKDGC
jgi:RNase H-fold protein (predicted Holliday junction resolvase)